MQTNNMRQVYVDIGEWYVARMPASEVMMHMRLTDTLAVIKLYQTDHGSYMVEILDPLSHRQLSGPVLPGEAGLYWDEYKHQYYFNERE